MDIETQHLSEGIYEARVIIDDTKITSEIGNQVATLESIETDERFRPWFHLKAVLTAEQEVGKLLDVEEVETLNQQYNYHRILSEQDD